MALKKTAKTKFTEGEMAEKDIGVDVAPRNVVGVEYHNPNVGLTVREFSREDHGDDFAAVAQAFADKFAGKIVRVE